MGNIYFTGLKSSAISAAIGGHPNTVNAQEEDFFYPIRETAVGIPNAKLILYEGVGHDAMMKRQFSEDVLAFLTEGTI